MPKPKPKPELSEMSDHVGCDRPLCKNQGMCYCDYESDDDEPRQIVLLQPNVIVQDYSQLLQSVLRQLLAQVEPVM